MEHPGFHEIERALEEMAAASGDYHLTDTPDRLIELVRMTSAFVKIAVESKAVSQDEMYLIKSLFNVAVERWLRQQERGYLDAKG